MQTEGRTRFHGRYFRHGLFPPVLMMLAVAIVYTPLTLLRGNSVLFGMDYTQLHARRLAYARDAIFSGHSFPGWYSRELLGTPFWSNIHNFSWIPNHLLLLVIPSSLAYFVAVLLATGLSSLFTYLFCRRIGFGALAAAVAGWTFACSGFFAAHMLAGHLPLLEAYPTLPMLLWLSERYLSSAELKGSRVAPLAFLAAGSAATALAGHPQLPFYALVTCALYLLIFGAGKGRLLAIFTMLLGCLSTLFIWWPMGLLLLRSARASGGAAVFNDVFFPYRRLFSFVNPWLDGWPSLVALRPLRNFGGYANEGFFWDTFSYAGLLPLIALMGLAAVGLYRRDRCWHRIGFLAVLGLLALFLALPFSREAFEASPVMFLRSPARQVYCTMFALAVACGYGFHWIVSSLGTRGRLSRMILIVLLLGHMSDLYLHLHPFLRCMPKSSFDCPQMAQRVEATVGNGRAAIDFNLPLAFNRTVDDAGFFDAVSLAYSYRTVLALSGLDPRSGAEYLRGSDMPIKLLAALGSRVVVTTKTMQGLDRLAECDTVIAYLVPSPAARAAYFVQRSVSFPTPEQASQAFPLSGLLQAGPPREVLLPAGAQDGLGKDTGGFPLYERPSSDEMRITLSATQPGVLRLLESWDPGWRAEVDGSRAEIWLANRFMMAVPLEPGQHEVTMRYSTPGAHTGLALSSCALLVLALLLGRSRTYPQISPVQTDSGCFPFPS